MSAPVLPRGVRQPFRASWQARIGWLVLFVYLFSAWALLICIIACVIERPGERLRRLRRRDAEERR